MFPHRACHNPLNVMFNAKQLARQTALAEAIIANFEAELEQEKSLLNKHEANEHLEAMWLDFYESDDVQPMSGQRKYHA